MHIESTLSRSYGFGCGRAEPGVQSLDIAGSYAGPAAFDRRAQVVADDVEGSVPSAPCPGHESKRPFVIRDMARKTLQRSESVIGYLRVSTAEQADSGLGLDAQRAAIAAECSRRGWMLDAVYEDAGASGKALGGRPQLAAALERLDRGDAGTLVVAKLDRLTRSVRDAADLLDRSARRGWSLIALDLGVDTTSPAGEAMAHVVAVFAQLERRLIGQRTKDALAVRRSQGVRLGRPRSLPEAIVERIVAEHDQGGSWSAIARGLDADGVPTAQGGRRWYPATVRAVCLANAEAAA
jgi:DNA invertase Pin-like site-specific DNA recombinase